MLPVLSALLLLLVVVAGDVYTFQSSPEKALGVVALQELVISYRNNRGEPDIRIDNDVFVKGSGYHGCYQPASLTKIRTILARRREGRDDSKVLRCKNSGNSLKGT